MGLPIRLMIADDHALVRAGLAHLFQSELDIKIVGEATDGEEAIEMAGKLKPDVILMDIYMPRTNGLEAMLAIKESLPETRVLVLTISDKEQDVFQALRYGADGFILKSANISEVPDAVRRAAGGETILSPTIAKRLVQEFRRKPTGVALSAREMEVFQFVGEGLPNNQIAKRLFISEATVRTYINRLLNKLHLESRTEAIAYAQKHLGNGRLDLSEPR